MNFNERLKEYREKLGFKTKQEFANKLGMKVSLYTKLENGDRKPSENALKAIVDFSGLPEVYWIYGILDNEYFENREILSSTKECIEMLIKIGVIKDTDLNNEIKEVIFAALKADIKHLLEKNKANLD